MGGRSCAEDVSVVALLAWLMLAIPVISVDEAQPRLHQDDEDTGPHFHSEEEIGGHAEREEVAEVWLTKGEIQRRHLLEVQALIVKDEQVTDDCQPSKRDLRKSNWRHFMCYGSILSNVFILTTTSCLHEALYIRHNIRATLAVAIAPVSESIQVIKISQYLIHPKLDVDPRHTEGHIKHDIAIAKLACKISKKNLFPIELPTKPMSELCEDDNCYVAVIKRTIDHSNLIFEYLARDIDNHKLVARQAGIKDATKSRQICTKTGSAVMADKIQAGVVSMSCDVRQSETSWLYTDLFDNVDWIVSVADLERPKSSDSNSNEKSQKKCSSCVYNFFFDWKQKDMCPNKIINDLLNDKSSSTTCKGNATKSEPKEDSSNYIVAYPKEDYLRALDVMYRDQYKHNHDGVPIAPPSEKKMSLNDQMIPVTDDFEVSRQADTDNSYENENVDSSEAKENKRNKKTHPSNEDENLNVNTPKAKENESSKSTDPSNKDRNSNIDIPAPKENESSKKTDTSNKDEHSNVDKPVPKENENKESPKSSNKIVDEVAPQKNADVPDEYMKLYNQYLQELQLKNG